MVVIFRLEVEMRLGEYAPCSESRILARLDLLSGQNIVGIYFNSGLVKNSVFYFLELGFGEKGRWGKWVHECYLWVMIKGVSTKTKQITKMISW